MERPRNNCTGNYRPILSSERVLHIKKPAIVREIKKSGHVIQMTVGRKLTSTSTSGNTIHLHSLARNSDH
jgi:hypothetical protein